MADSTIHLFPFSHPSSSSSQSPSSDDFFSKIKTILKDENHTEDEILEFMQLLQEQKIRNLKKLTARLLMSSTATIFCQSETIQDCVDSLFLSNKLDLSIETNSPSHPFYNSFKAAENLKSKDVAKISQISTHQPSSIRTLFDPSYSAFSTPVDNSPYLNYTSTSSFDASHIHPQIKFPSAVQSSSIAPPTSQPKKKRGRKRKIPEVVDGNTAVEQINSNNVYKAVQKIGKSKQAVNLQTTNTFLSHLLPLTVFLCSDGSKYESAVEARIISVLVSKNRIVKNSLQFVVEFPIGSNIYWPTILEAFTEAWVFYTGSTQNQNHRRWRFKFLNESGRIELSKSKENFIISKKYYNYMDEILSAEVRAGSKIISWKQLVSKKENEDLFEKLNKIHTELQEILSKANSDDAPEIREFLQQHTKPQEFKMEEKKLQTTPLTNEERKKYGFKLKTEPTSLFFNDNENVIEVGDEVDLNEDSSSSDNEV